MASMGKMSASSRCRGDGAGHGLHDGYHDGQQHDGQTVPNSMFEMVLTSIIAVVVTHGA